MLTALVVDDSSPPAPAITTLLQLGGWRVHQAVGTEDALRLAAVIEPDLVVTDMVMRNGHGATLMRRLREQGSTARFLVVAARRTHQTLALAAAAGALACLAKPVDPRLFVDVMRGLAPVARVRRPPGRRSRAAGRARRSATRGDVPERAAAPPVGDRGRAPRQGTPPASPWPPRPWPRPATGSGTPRSRSLSSRHRPRTRRRGRRRPRRG